MLVYLVRRLGALVVTVVGATTIAHVFLTTTVEGYRLLTAIRGTPEYLIDGFLRGDFGTTFGGGCPPEERIKPCGSYPASTIVDMWRERVPIDVSLLLGGLLLGTLAGIAGGRRVAMKPRSWSARALKVALDPLVRLS